MKRRIGSIICVLHVIEGISIPLAQADTFTPQLIETAGARAELLTCIEGKIIDSPASDPETAAILALGPCNSYLQRYKALVSSNMPTVSGAADIAVADIIRDAKGNARKLFELQHPPIAK